MQDLTKHTYFAYALQMYRNPSCTGIEEFRDDLVRLKYIKRLLHRYVRTGHIRTQLLLNHVVGVNNVFLPEATARLLFYRIHPSAWRALKTTLSFLNIMPDVIPSVNGQVVLNSDISHDHVLVKLLQETIENHGKSPQSY